MSRHANDVPSLETYAKELRLDVYRYIDPSRMPHVILMSRMTLISSVTLIVGSDFSSLIWFIYLT